MGDLSAVRNTEKMLSPFGMDLEYPVLSGATIYQGGGVAIGSAGTLVHASAAGALHTVGRACKTVTGDGTKTLKVEMGVFKFGNAAAHLLSAGHLMGACYWEDDNTVGSNSTKLLAGVVLKIESDGVFVLCGPFVPAAITAAAYVSGDSPSFAAATIAGAATVGTTLGVTGVSSLLGGEKLSASADAPIAKVAVVTVTAAQLRNLAGTQKELVAAQAGKFFMFKGAAIQYRGGTFLFDSVGAGEDLAIRYENGSGAIVSATLDTTTDINFGATTDANAVMPALATVVVAPVNKALVLDNVGGGELASTDVDAHGDGIVTMTVFYDEYTATA